MPALDLGADYVDGQTATAEVFNDKFDAIKTLLNTTKLDQANIQLPALTSALVSGGHLVGANLDTADGRLKQTTGVHEAGSNLTLTGSYQDVPSALTAFTPDVACYALVTAAFCFVVSSVDAGEAVTLDGSLDVDGATQTQTAQYSFYGSSTVTTQTVTVSQVYRVALSAAPHTLKLRARKLTEAGTTTAIAGAGNTRFIYQLVAQ